MAISLVCACPQFCLSQSAIDYPVESVEARPLSSATAVSKLAATSPLRKVATAEGVIFLDIGTGDGAIPQCMGTLIGARLVLTARHCLYIEDPATRQLEKAPIALIYLLLDHMDSSSGTKIALEPEPLDFGKAADLDYAILRTKAAVELADRQLPKPGGDPPLQTELLIFHQPFGAGLAITGHECQTTDHLLEGPVFEHYCRTAPGTSGAGIFDMSSNLIGIHLSKSDTSGVGGTVAYGLLLSKIMSDSSVAFAALNDASSSSRLAVSAPSEAPGSGFKLSDGSSFLEDRGVWSFTPSAPKGAGAHRLQAQSGSSGALLLWDPIDDVVYQIVTGDGSVRRRKSGDATWQELGKGERV